MLKRGILGIALRSDATGWRHAFNSTSLKGWGGCGLPNPASSAEATCLTSVGSRTATPHSQLWVKPGLVALADVTSATEVSMT